MIINILCNLNMELNAIVFPAPPSSYNDISVNQELVWIPQLKNEKFPSIPCGFFQCPTGSSKIMIYFHGNAEDIGTSYPIITHLRKTLQVNILAVEYPGYGIYKGKASSKRIEADAKNILDYLIYNEKINPNNILIFGRSIGSGPAVYLASNYNIRALFLMSAYISIKTVARHLTCWAFFLKDRFKNVNLMKKIQCPILLLHGKKDPLIVYHNSEVLRDQCRPGQCELVLNENMTHNDFDLTDISDPFLSFLHQREITTSVNENEINVTLSETLYKFRNTQISMSLS
ncbi:unnamed protein product [Blepharisma stoltei]|uniref:Alpha/beta hydrolase n=1 Tax=Blepharisma stoltei TaxID=1481888 RepID=A0AAU9KJX8_9CILI|nr:unnamed protein product [Blepharisma stoltei]